MQDREKLIEKARKLAELAKRGEGGEALNAFQKLQAMMQEHNLNFDEVAGKNVKKSYIFDNDEHIGLLVVCLSCVLQKAAREVQALVTVMYGGKSGIVTLDETQHGELASLFVHHKVGLFHAYESEKESYENELARFRNSIADYKRLIKETEKARDEFRKARPIRLKNMFNGYCNKNRLYDYAGYKTATAKESRDIQRAKDFAPDVGAPNKLPAQSLPEEHIPLGDLDD